MKSLREQSSKVSFLKFITKENLYLVCVQVVYGLDTFFSYILQRIFSDLDRF